ncbi:MAG TPA: DUF2147 domain-containing protein [Luteibacter sp.]|jgi:uncharacterized protein (DUF2147 family)|uniref:DUF2147 domain-containing protein n=1 Tax=Luteibacter sp. TaxID=1886636 RepID=UPI002F41F7B7
MKKNSHVLKMLSAFLVLASGSVFAQSTPVGLWRVFDDDTKQPLSLVRVTESGGLLSGKMEALLDPARQDAKCIKCTDERKDQPMLGMVIMRDVKTAGDGTWDGGNILDPNNGKVYRVRLKPIEGGNRLEIRGYIGPFFRNQYWSRVQ